MFLDAFGIPRDVTPDNLHEYSYDMNGIMLLTSAESQVYIPPNWHGTIYSTEELLHGYRKRFNPDPMLLTFHALTPYEPELICCERKVVEITVLPAGHSLYSSENIVVFLAKLNEANMLITKELGNDLNIFPLNHHYHARIMEEGIDIIFIDDYIYHTSNHNQHFNYLHQRIYNLVNIFKPYAVKSLRGRILPKVLRSLCRNIDSDMQNLRVVTED